MDQWRQPEEVIRDGERVCGEKVGGDKVSRVEDWKRESCWYRRLGLVRREEESWCVEGRGEGGKGRERRIYRGGEREKGMEAPLEIPLEA